MPSARGGQLPLNVCRSFFVAALLAAPGVADVAGQAVTGDVYDAETGRPMRGVYVQLLASDGAVLASALTSDAGQFLLRTASPGTVVLRAEQIGFHSQQSDTIRLSAGETVHRRLLLYTRALRMEALEVEAERRCTLARDLALQTLSLWEQAQQTFRRAEWDARRRARVFRFVTYERSLDERTGRVLRERADSGTSRGAAFVSADSAAIAENGFVQQRGARWEFHAPDPGTLVSGSFVEGYCLRARQLEPGSSRIGIDFEPVVARSAADVRGTVWFDVATMNLRAVDFTWTWIPWDVARDGIGGRIEFAPLTDGGWIVQRWSVRTPRVETSAGNRGHRRVGIDESAGEVLRVLTPAGEMLASFDGARLNGVVYDSVRGGAAAGVTIRVEPTGRNVVTDATGRFLMEGLSGGVYRVVAGDENSEDVAADVQLEAGRTASVALALPSAETRLRRQCASSGIVGVVRDSGGRPVPALPVSAAMADGFTATSTNAEGGYVLCGFAPGANVQVMVGQPARPDTTVMVRVDSTVTRQDLILPVARRQDARGRIAGVVLGPDSTAFSAAIVRVDSEQRPSITDAGGRFVISDLPAGPHTLSVEALGHGSVSQTIEVRPGELVRVVISLGIEAVRLAPIEVVARSELPGPLADFALRREWAGKLGLGVFFGPDELQWHGSGIFDILGRVPGVRFAADPEHPGNRVVLFGRGGSACVPKIYVDGVIVNRNRYDPLEYLVPTGPYAAVEIYRSPAELPAEFGGADGRCGAIVIWMHRR